VEIEGVV